MAGVIVFYDLVSAPGRPFFSPNTFKARLCLLQKGVRFETREVTYRDLRTHIRERLGGNKVLVPMIELPDGTLIQESANIADFLERTYPDVSSVFLPGAALPVDTSSPEYATARNYALLVDAGLGDSDPEWSTWWELSAPGIEASLSSEGPDCDRDYLKSDEKLGQTDGWQTLTSHDQAALIRRAHASLIPITKVLSQSAWLSGRSPGYVDYVLYGRYMMMVAATPAVAFDVWKGKAPVKDWIERLEALYHDGLEDVLSRLPMA